MKDITANTRLSDNPLGYAPVLGLIGKFAIPSIISMMVAAAYNITDQIFIGHKVGMLGNGATNVVFPVVTFTTAFAQLIGVGTAANFNINMGAKREKEAKYFIGTGITLMSIIGLFIFSIVFLLKRPILLLCGATENVLPLAMAYLGITVIGLPFQLFTTASSSLIRADGSPTYSMICNITGAILNVFLDWLFMFVFGWGIQGAAIATVIGQILSFSLCAIYYFKFKTFQITRGMLGIKWRYVIRIIKLGTSNFINHTIMMIVNIVLNNSLKIYGAMSIYGSDIPLAVSGVIAKLNSILSAVSIGLAQGCQPILGFNMGAKNYSRVKETYKKAVSIAIAVSVLAFILFQCFPRQITGIFGSGSDLYFQFAEKYLRIYMFMVCFFGVQPVTINYFTGTGNVKQGIILSLSRQGFFLIPLLLILPQFLGLTGVLYAGPIADLMACLLSFAMIALNFRKLDSQQGLAGK
ncbi:MAG TPA: MATE family efflux transporter [Clostridiaceae bacterium]|nr:MATE family efflux transporter [Clostridiaceae bacterium]